MPLIKYRLKTLKGMDVCGEYLSECPADVLGPSCAQPRNAEGVVAWNIILKKLTRLHELKGPVVYQSMFVVLKDKDESKPFARTEEFESLFKDAEGNLLIQNPERSGKWVVYEKAIPKAFNNRVANAKAAGFQSAFYRKGKIGVLCEDLSAIG